MNEFIIPTAEQLPVSWQWFQILLLLTFLLHLIFMNLVLGGSLITLVNMFRGKETSKGATSLPTLVALTINLGVPPLLFVQVLYGNFFYTSSVIMAWPWLLVIPILILAYYGAYIFVYKQEKNQNLAKFSLLASSLLLLLIAFFYVNNLTLMLEPGNWSHYFADPRGTNLNLAEPTLIPRFLHFVVAAIAVAGLGQAVYAYFNKKADEELKKAERESGLKIFAYATMAQLVIGIWLLIALPQNIMMQFMGQNMMFTLMLLLGIGLMVVAIILGIQKKVMLTVYTLLPLLVIMVLIRDFVRRAYLGDIFKSSEMEVSGQYGSMILFLLAFVVGLGALYYMIMKLINSKKASL